MDGAGRIVTGAGGPRLIGAGVLDATGTGLLIPLTVLFFVIHVGLPAHLVGLGMSVGGVLAMAMAPLGGHLVDRHGAKRSLIGAWLLGCAAVSCYTLVRSWPEIIVVISAVGFAGNVSGTSRSTLIASLVDRAEISRVMAVQRSFRNIGYGLGGLMATAALAAGAAGFVAAIAVDAASFVLAALLVSGLAVPARRSPVPAPDADPVTVLTVLRDRRYMAVTAFDALTAFHQVALQVALPLWVVLYTHAPRALVGLLFTVNTAIVVIAQVRISREVRGLLDAAVTYLRAAAAMIAAAALFLASHYVGAAAAVLLLVVGAILMTAAEMYASAADWVVSFGLADDHHRGKYLAIYSMGDAFGDAVGPSITTALTSVGAIPVWPVIALLVTVGSLASGALARSAADDAAALDPRPALG